MKKTSIVIFLVGLAIGLLIAKFGGWDILEPVIGVATLAVSAIIWLRSKVLERKIGESMDQKKFEITFGLRAGYEGEGVDFTIDDAKKIIKKWMEERISAGKPILAGMIAETTLIYPVRNLADGSRVTAELSGQFSGSLSPKYDKGRDDKEVVETLNNLSRFLGKELRQKRIYVSFVNKQWVLEV